MTAECIQG